LCSFPNKDVKDGKDMDSTGFVRVFNVLAVLAVLYVLVSGFLRRMCGQNDFHHRSLMGKLGDFHNIMGEL